MRWSGMHLTGTIPTEIGNMIGLSTLVMAYNDLGGTIPSQLTLLTSLGKLNLRNNLFTGVFPQLSKSQFLSEW